MKKKLDIYDKMLKALEKGHTLFLDVKYIHSSNMDRIRILSPNTCMYSMVKEKERMVTSCFVYKERTWHDNLNRSKYTKSEDIISEMKYYDFDRLKISKVMNCNTGRYL